MELVGNTNYSCFQNVFVLFSVLVCFIPSNQYLWAFGFFLGLPKGKEWDPLLSGTNMLIFLISSIHDQVWDRVQNCVQDKGLEAVQDIGLKPVQDRGLEPVQDRGQEPVQDRGLEPVQNRGLETTLETRSGLVPEQKNKKNKNLH